MKNIKYLLAFSLLLIATSCKKDFLQLDLGTSLPESQVFGDPVLAARFADNSYTYLINDYFRFQNSSEATSQFTDEAIIGTGDVNDPSYIFYKGFYKTYSLQAGSLNEIKDIYSRMYSGIRNVNKFLSVADQVPWTAAQDIKRIKGEQYFLRAFFYFELTKRFGGVILMKQVYLPTDNIDFPRNSYDECVSFMLSDLAQAENALPVTYDDANNGRATLGAARALKARILLYAASKLHNPSNDLAKWQAAADAAKAVMDMNLYSLQPKYDDIIQVAKSPEFIMYQVRGPRAASSFILNLTSNGSGGTRCSVNPTQNHVDLYEMQATGKPITDPTSGYNPQQPYAGRDPRFYVNIVYNGSVHANHTIGIWEDRTGPTPVYGADYNPSTVFTTKTGYYCKRMWPTVYYTNSTQTALVNFIYFRFAEILLNYAEAQNEATGPDASVYSAVNQVRKRAGMPDLPAGLTKDQMRDRIRNEDAVEFAFEDHRLYDTMRWVAGKQIIAKPTYGMDIQRQKNGTFVYTPKLLPDVYQKTVEDYMSLFPLPDAEIRKSNGVLAQNPGW